MNFPSLHLALKLFRSYELINFDFASVPSSLSLLSLDHCPLMLFKLGPLEDIVCFGSGSGSSFEETALGVLLGSTPICFLGDASNLI